MDVYFTDEKIARYNVVFTQERVFIKNTSEISLISNSKNNTIKKRVIEIVRDLSKMNSQSK